MGESVSFKFESGLDFQIEAIESVIDLFEGMNPQADVRTIVHSETGVMGMVHNEIALGNALIPSTDAMLENLRKVQRRHNIPVSRSLIEEDSPYPFANFSIEMETGTGRHTSTSARYSNSTAGAGTESSSSWCRRSRSAKA